MHLQVIVSQSAAPEDVETEPQYLAAGHTPPDDRCRLCSGNKILRVGQGTGHLGSCPETKAKAGQGLRAHSSLNVKRVCGKGLAWPARTRGTAGAGGIRLDLSTCSPRKQKGRRKIREASEILYLIPFQQARKNVTPVKGKRALMQTGQWAGLSICCLSCWEGRCWGQGPHRITSDYTSPPPAPAPGGRVKEGASNA